MSIRSKLKEFGYKWIETEDELTFIKKKSFFTTSKIIIFKHLKSIAIDGCNLVDIKVMELIMEEIKDLKTEVNNGKDKK